ncbi:MAG: hypothetical protein JNL71_02190 [Rhodospirillales bacterium]|nr:hypothetical protein [Rhodospirillales bacterium]
MRVSLSIAACCAILASGCTPMRWEHPAFGPEEAGREAQDCRQQAWAEAQRQSFMYFGPRYVRDRKGRLYPHYYPDFSERQFAEMRLNDFCMRNKGFALVPVR